MERSAFDQLIDYPQKHELEFDTQRFCGVVNSNRGDEDTDELVKVFTSLLCCKLYSEIEGFYSI